ncbi:hypothetical protein SKAU_G00328740 [Synaphobranchus kaupii]|uniref:CARD domain-containing protein n=1 Tax=Synaphobranchus kaupii TaxID=118154 RepID=A0A9Q1IKI3_SYNKA|nr:hypothetical protein SKAU_G00328740 [Synaphobranchus kaupii]
MAAELFKVRTQFVEKVSLVVVHQLLDDLLQKQTLNGGEVDEVREEHRQRVDQARDLIDMVRRKGDIASKQLMQCLEFRDPRLFEELRWIVVMTGDEPMVGKNLL